MSFGLRKFKFIPFFTSTKKNKANGNKSGAAAQNGMNNISRNESGYEAGPTSGMPPVGLMSINDLPQPQFTSFEDADETFEPEEHIVIYCMNGQDNVPARVKLGNGFVYYISQSRSPGHKDQGQDCLSFARMGDWEIHLLCDGHDKAGHMVALGVCQQLPRILLRKISEAVKAGSDGQPMDPNLLEVSDNLVNEAFDECARVVCWTKEGITVGIWVKVFDGQPQWIDKPGYIKESDGHGRVKVAIIDETGYHLPAIERSKLRRPRYTGGCTCLCLIRNRKTKECKVAVSGDSRMLIIPTMNIVDSVLLTQFGVDESLNPSASFTMEPSKKIPQGLVTPAHNVFNEDEKARLEADYSGQYEFDGNFLVNPITKFAIQPTRGFGDFDMFGTGYTHSPEITKTFKLRPNGMIFSASDGVFDSHVWSDEELVSALDKYAEEGMSNTQIVENMYRETVHRSLEGGYVDDISIYCFIEPSEEKEGEKKNENGIVVENTEVSDEPLPVRQISAALPTAETVPKKKDLKDKRKTIGRNAETMTDLSALVLERRKKKAEEAAVAKAGKDDVPEKLTDVADNQILDGVGQVMKNMAKVNKLSGVDPKVILTSDDVNESETPSSTDLI